MATDRDREEDETEVEAITFGNYFRSSSFAWTANLKAATADVNSVLFGADEEPDTRWCLRVTAPADSQWISSYLECVKLDHRYAGRVFVRTMLVLMQGEDEDDNDILHQDEFVKVFSDTSSVHGTEHFLERTSAPPLLHLKLKVFWCALQHATPSPEQRLCKDTMEKVTKVCAQWDIEDWRSCRRTRRCAALMHSRPFGRHGVFWVAYVALRSRVNLIHPRSSVVAGVRLLATPEPMTNSGVRATVVMSLNERSEQSSKKRVFLCNQEEEYDFGSHTEYKQKVMRLRVTLRFHGIKCHKKQKAKPLNSRFRASSADYDADMISTVSGWGHTVQSGVAKPKLNECRWQVDLKRAVDGQSPTCVLLSTATAHEEPLEWCLEVNSCEEDPSWLEAHLRTKNLKKAEVRWSLLAWHQGQPLLYSEFNNLVGVHGRQRVYGTCRYLQSSVAERLLHSGAITVQVAVQWSRLSQNFLSAGDNIVEPSGTKRSSLLCCLPAKVGERSIGTRARWRVANWPAQGFTRLLRSPLFGQGGVLWSLLVQVEPITNCLSAGIQLHQVPEEVRQQGGVSAEVQVWVAGLTRVWPQQPVDIHDGVSFVFGTLARFQHLSSLHVECSVRCSLLKNSPLPAITDRQPVYHEVALR